MSEQKDCEYIPRPYKVTDYVRETTDTFTIKVDMKIKHDPGQFVQVSIPGIGEAPISICSDSEEYVQLNVREVGNMTKALSKIKKGDTLLIRGPYGKGYPMKDLKGKDVIIIGGGCGVAPLRGVIEYIENNRKNFKDVIMFLGYRSPDDIIFKKDLKVWKKRYKIDMTVDENPKSKFCYDAKTGFVTEALKESKFTFENKVAFLCGPPIMMKFTINILKGKGLDDDQIFISAERLMYCGIGVCCHCMIHGKYTCLDGPVFRYDEIKRFKND
ncbi:MAG: FAD/NAD(P)-binding protein [Candidatus Woesearchaeota archaeon]